MERIDLLPDKGYQTGIELARCERRGGRLYVSPKEPNEQSQGFNKFDFKYEIGINGLEKKLNKIQNALIRTQLKLRW